MSPAGRLVQRTLNTSLLRSLGHRLGRITYKHFVPAGLVALMFGVLLFAIVRDSKVSASSMTVPNSKPVLDKATVDPQDQNIDFSQFLHGNPNHVRLACLLCHRREGGSSRPDLPGGSGHQPCAGCHAKEFSDSSNPICGICHAKPPSPELKVFPSLKSFNVRFDHSLHLGGAARSSGCATCHRPVRNGIALSIPVGFNAHAVCYQCHGPHAQIARRDISSCGTCHRLGGYTRTPSNAGAFRVGFSHSDHDASKSLKCADCHGVKAGLPQRRQVTSPVPLNHHASAGTLSCMTCHNGTRAFGGDDFSVCIRCHTGNAWHF